jgi:PAS domain S-box-containing protein
MEHQERPAFFRSTEGGWWVKVDRRIARWLGCLKSDLLDHGWCDFIAEEDRDLTRWATDRLQAGLTPPPYTQRWIARNGRTVTFTIHLFTTQRTVEKKEIVGRIHYDKTTRPRLSPAFSGSTRAVS